MSGMLAAPWELGWYRRRGSRQALGFAEPKRARSTANAEAAAACSARRERCCSA